MPLESESEYIKGRELGERGGVPRQDFATVCTVREVVFLLKTLRFPDNSIEVPQE